MKYLPIFLLAICANLSAFGQTNDPNFNPVATSVQQVETWTGWLMNLGPAPFAVLSVLAFGYLIRLIPVIENKWIPFACPVIGMIVFPILSLEHRYHYHTDEPLVYFLLRAVFTGLIIGLGTWAFHDKIISTFEGKIPLLGKFLEAAKNQTTTPPQT